MLKFKTAADAFPAVAQGEFIHFRPSGLPPSLRHSAEGVSTQPRRRGRMVMFRKRPAGCPDARIPAVEGDRHDAAC